MCMPMWAYAATLALTWASGAHIGQALGTTLRRYRGRHRRRAR